MGKTKKVKKMKERQTDRQTDKNDRQTDGKIHRQGDK